MSSEADLILSAIGDGCGNRAAIAEHTGLDLKLVSNRLFTLNKKGEIAKGENGWELNGAAAAPATTVTKPDDAPPQRRTRKAKPAPKVAPKRASKAPTPALRQIVSPANGRQCEFAISESGAILFKVVAGPKAGELGAIGHVDAMALFRLMDSCDFIRDNA